jgi:hypothetical protein
LDFLGFPWISLVRIETFQWVTRDKSVKSFSARLSPRCEESGSEIRGVGLRKIQIDHGASYHNI